MTDVAERDGTPGAHYTLPADSTYMSSVIFSERAGQGSSTALAPAGGRVGAGSIECLTSSAVLRPDQVLVVVSNEPACDEFEHENEEREHLGNPSWVTALHAPERAGT
ncbi:MAG: hypothetical protein ACT4PE_05115 [Candidatus Eiseniibacteriota bacterium]